MHDTRFQGLDQSANWVKHRFAAMNLKKFSKMKRSGSQSGLLLLFCPQYIQNPACASSADRVSRQRSAEFSLRIFL